MPIVDGLTAARKILASGQDVKILILSLHDSKNVIRQVVDSGAKGFVLKSDSSQRVQDLLRGYSERFVRDFLATAPVPDKPTS